MSGELGAHVILASKTEDNLTGDQSAFYRTRTIGFGRPMALLQFGTLPADLTERYIRAFAEKVMPARA